MLDQSHPERRVVVSVDMESYSKRSNRLQYRAQTAFRQIMEEATAPPALRRADWKTQQGGDGELGILPPGVSERLVLGMVPVLDGLLREHNHGLATEARVRLRIAVHQGLVHMDGANGFPGDAVVFVSRLIDAPALKRTLHTFPGANVALIVSDSVYREVVQQYEDLRPELFAPMKAELPDKDFSAAAWIYVPGENAAGESAPPRPAAASSATTSDAGQVFTGINAYGPAAFGNHNTLHATSPATDESGRPHGR